MFDVQGSEPKQFTANCDSPLYSVVIPTFNRCDWVIEAIDSILAQSYPHLDIVVIDDGSSDQTQATLQRYGDKLRYVHQANRGPAVARNRGIQLCRGNYIALLDSDDLWRPQKIQNELRIFAAYPDVDAIAGDATCFLHGQLLHPSLFRACGIHFPDEKPRNFGGDLHRIALGPLCSTSSMVFRRETLLQLGPNVYDPGLRYNEDWDLEFRLFAHFKVLLCPDVVSINRQYDDGTRQYYSLPRQPKSKTEKMRLSQLNLNILQRYCNLTIWPQELQNLLTRRVDELQQLLRPQYR